MHLECSSKVVLSLTIAMCKGHCVVDPPIGMPGPLPMLLDPSDNVSSGVPPRLLEKLQP